MRGIVKLWKENGYGFITSDGKDVFVHANDLLLQKSLTVGTILEFEVKETEKGFRTVKGTVREITEE